MGAEEIVCPRCGGRDVCQITPREFECVTLHPGGFALGPGGVPFSPGGFPEMRPCTHRFLAQASVRSTPGAGDRESSEERERKFVREAEAEQDRQRVWSNFRAPKRSPSTWSGSGGGGRCRSAPP